MLIFNLIPLLIYQVSQDIPTGELFVYYFIAFIGGSFLSKLVLGYYFRKPKSK